MFYGYVRYRRRLKNACPTRSSSVLVGLGRVKTSGAAPILTRRWHAAIEEHSAISLKQRLVANIGITIAGSAQTISYAGVVIVGVGLIAAGVMTMGGLIACSILSGRAVAPLGPIPPLLSRLPATRPPYRQPTAPL